MTTFGSFSGYKLNIQKSECFPINQLATELPPLSLPFRISNSGFKYLGIAITQSFSALQEQNLTVLTATVKSDLQRWGHLALSLAGRVQTIKMNVLPRYLYIFQCLPIFLPKSFFTAIDNIISSFILAGKHARASYCRGTGSWVGLVYLTLWLTTGPQTHTRSCSGSLRPRVTGVLWRPTHVDPRHFKPSRVALCPFPPHNSHLTPL